MFWNLNYWDSVSCLAGEVDNPTKTFPRALMYAVVLVVASYFLPTLAALGVSIDTADWQLGYYGKVAQQVGGNWLAWWIVLAAAASQVGQFQAEMSSDSYQLQGMAERGFLPKALARRSRHGTPTYGILLSSLGVVCLASFSFVDIVELLNAVYCLAELLEFAAFVWLRIKAPYLPRPYRVPLPTWGLIVLLTPATLLLLAVLILPILERNHTMIFATSAAVVIGFILYPLFTMAKEKKWMSFSNLQFDFAHDTAGNARTYTIHASGHLNYDASYNVEYVDVCHDGDTGVRTTGSSMDLGSDHRWGIGSSGRGPGSVADSLGGFAVGQSPRSPFVGRYAHHHSRAVSAPAAVAMAVAAAAPAGPDSSATAAGRSRLSYAIVHTAAADGAAGTHSAGAAGATLTVVGSAASAPLTSGNLSDVAESGELVDEEMPLLDSAAKTAAGMAASERANEV
eukprot:GHRR01007781.1.p1 GENE.GHRR01007781.1~~GHRR01007781.1.p1  ORF type:complete len:454 (+),score=154.91 GHRR01007781.1:1207-2568(+)